MATMYKVRLNVSLMCADIAKSEGILLESDDVDRILASEGFTPAGPGEWIISGANLAKHGNDYVVSKTPMD